MSRIVWKRLGWYLTAAAVAVLAARSCASSCQRDAAEVILSHVSPTAVEISLGTPEPTDEIPLTVEYEVVHTQWIKVYDHKAENVLTMDLEEYVLGVVAGEMPVSFEPEALKAQSLATRTYSVYGIIHGGCGTCADADVCTNSQCCQAYASPDKLKERWGTAFDANYSKLSRAVSETAGLILTYDGQVIDALYHGSSAGGYTEDSENVFSAAIPYLRSVTSENEIGSRQTGEVRLSFADFCAAANAAYPDASLTPELLPASVSVTSLYPSGRVEKARIGGTSITGKQMRKLLGLDSAWFTVSFTASEIVFSTRGFGHGVGMSQAGANGMAAAGAAYDAILLHYYTGVTISEYKAPETP